MRLLLRPVVFFVFVPRFSSNGLTNSGVSYYPLNKSISQILHNELLATTYALLLYADCTIQNRNCKI